MTLSDYTMTPLSVLSLLITAFLSLTLAEETNTQDREPIPSAPDTIFSFNHVGCFRLDRDDPSHGFHRVEQWEFMSLNQCISDCHHSNFAAIFNDTCLCSANSDALASIDSQPDCNDPCPGNAEQACGAASPVGPHLFTVYANAEPRPPPHEELRAREVLQQPLPNPDSETVHPTLITVTYSNLCVPPVCESVYLSAVVTSVHAMVTKAPDTGAWREMAFDAAEAAHEGMMPSVPMREVQKLYTVPAGGVVVALSDEKDGYDEILEKGVEDGDEETIEEEAVEIRMWEGEVLRVVVTVPDEEIIERMEAEVEEWRAKQEETGVETGAQNEEETSDHVMFYTDETDTILDSREAQPGLRDMGKVNGAFAGIDGISGVQVKPAKNP
jgi:hypothetical protein